MPAVGRLVRECRLEADLTQEALAHAIGCSKAHLSLMESGQRTVSAERAERIEAALGVEDGRIVSAVHWRSLPADMRARVEESEDASRRLAARLRKALRDANPTEALRRLVEESASNVDAPLPLARRIPVINSIAAGYPAEFTDLDYPASIADDYIACPDVTDPDAFAARVVGDSMAPHYGEGEIVVFSPALPTPSGSDCFVRLERDNETTFKRVYYEDDGRTIRLQPLNNAYPPRLVAREHVTGIYAAAYVMRKVRP
jgi:phage repressor protein C with HTH and peptisase S24 domain